MASVTKLASCLLIICMLILSIAPVNGDPSESMGSRRDPLSDLWIIRQKRDIFVSLKWMQVQADRGIR